MKEIRITRHGEIRMAQRGINGSDLELVLTLGTKVGRDRIMLKKRVAAETVQTLKNLIAQVERAKGKLFVVKEGRLVTAYHQTKPIRKQRRRKIKSRPCQKVVG